MKQLKQFWSVYSRQIIRFWTNQLVMSFLGISIGLATIALDNLAMSIIGSVFSICFLCFLQYDNLFQLGLKVHYRSMDIAQPKRNLGLKISVLASLPLFILILLGVILQITQLESASMVFKFIYYALHGSYMQLHAFFTVQVGILSSSSIFMQCVGWLFYLLYTFPAIICSALGYVLGSKDRPLRTFFGIKVTGDGRKAGK